MTPRDAPARCVSPVGEHEDAVPERRQRLAELVRAQEDERARIAGDIHDDSVQAMTAVAMRLELLGHRVGDPVQAEQVRQLKETVRIAIGRLRHLLFQLHPPALERSGVVVALQEYLEQAANTFDGAVEFRDDCPSQPPVPLGIVLYRVAQEALANVMRHAAADHVTVRMSMLDDGYLIEVRDDGRGFVPEHHLGAPGHMGLETMRQRIELAGGRWQLESTPGAGTTVHAWVPALAPDPHEGP